MKPYYQDASVTIYHGDALLALASLPAGAADLLLTDPPYSSGGMMRGDRQQDPKIKYVQNGSENHDRLISFSGDSRDQMGWLFWVGAWLHGAQQVLGPGAISAFFCDWRQLAAAIHALQAGGVVWRGVVPWHKPNARPVQGRWSNMCEYLVWGTKGPRALDVLGPKAFPGMFTAIAPSGTEREHITQKPLSLMQSLVEIVPSGGLVLDPFMGSGTTLIAAKTMGRRAIGVEIDEQNCEIAARRCSQEVLDLGGAA
jgi:site-specific DNA-methyltransferase (adenine-specific)